MVIGVLVPTPVQAGPGEHDVRRTLLAIVRLAAEDGEIGGFGPPHQVRIVGARRLQDAQLSRLGIEQLNAVADLALRTDDHSQKVGIVGILPGMLGHITKTHVTPRCQMPDNDGIPDTPSSASTSAAPRGSPGTRRRVSRHGEVGPVGAEGERGDSLYYRLSTGREIPQTELVLNR